MVSAQRIIVWWTWLGIPYWRQRLPLDVEIRATGDFGGDDEAVVLEKRLHSEDVEFGSKKPCHALAEALQAAQRRFEP